MEKNPFVKEKTKDLIIITSIISTLLIGVLFTQLLNGYDKYMVYSLLIVDIIFINSLIQEKSRMIDVIHVFFIIYIFLALFSDNKYIISIFILKLSIMFCYWYYYNKCPMGNYETFEYLNCMLINHPFESTVIPILAFFVLIFKLCRRCFMENSSVSEMLECIPKSLQIH